MTDEAKSDIRDAQIRFLASTDRLLQAADDVRRDRDRLFDLLGREDRRGVGARRPAHAS